MSGRRSGTPAWRLVALVVAVTLVAGPFAHASPSTPAIRAAQQRAQAARAKLDELAADLEERTEDYYEAQHELEKTEARLREAERALAEATLELEDAQQRLNARASAIYRAGGLEFISVIVGAADLRDLVVRLDLMRRVAASDAALVGQVKRSKQRVAEVRTALARRRAEQLVLRDLAEQRRAAMQAAYEAQKRFIETLDAEVERLIAAERRRQQELARRRAAEAARRAAQAARTGRAGRAFDPAALGEPHPEVVAVARRFVGTVPYVWGGTTPEGFDCSGLVLYCYRELGIELPRTSRQQYRVGAYIPPDRMDLLRPGDLVFFGRNGDPARVHHVAIYSGDGMMVHAPQTGEMVSETSLLERIASRGDYVGAVRP